MFVKQNKGKMLDKVPRSKLETKWYYASRKFDGHYVQITSDGNGNVRFYTSGGKEFYLADMASYIIDYIPGSFHIECEYLYGCDGKLGSRGKSARLTTYRTDSAKGKHHKGNPEKDKFIILDRLDSSANFQSRLNSILSQFYGLDEWFVVPEHKVVDLIDGINLSKEFVRDGYEGAMLKHIAHIYEYGKRSNDIIKLKPRKTADLIVGDELEGIGKYEGLIGSLTLYDRSGTFVGMVGSGLTDYLRNRWGHFTGKVVEVEYEQFQDALIQPVFKCIRDDKSQSEANSISEL